MMKFVSTFILFVFAAFYVYADEQIYNLKETEPSLVVAKELQNLNHLITITEQNLENQKHLQKLFLDYQRQQMTYLQDTQNKETTLLMVKSAHRLLEGIKNYHLVHAFDTELISQLTFFSQFATKRGIPKT